MRPVFVAVIMLLALAGCGDGGEPAGSPEDTARSYVASLNHKDGARFCSLVAPYIAGEFDLGAHQLWAGQEEQAEKKLKVTGGCPLFVTAYTGYIDDPGEQWKRADVLTAGPARREGSLMAVPLRLRSGFLGTVTADRRADGKWRVSSGKDDDGNPRLISGDVSEDDARVSLAVNRSDVEYAADLPPVRDFVWSVSSLAPHTDQDSVLTDDAPDGYGVVYPSNRDCGIGTDGSCSTG